MFELIEHLNTLNTVCVYLSTSHNGRSGFVHDSYQSAAAQKASREKVLLSENVQIKIILDNTFRFLIASSGIARQGLNSLFCEPQIRPKSIFLTFFVCCSKLVCVHSYSFCQHGSHIHFHLSNTQIKIHNDFSSMVCSSTNWNHKQ